MAVTHLFSYDNYCRFSIFRGSSNARCLLETHRITVWSSKFSGSFFVSSPLWLKPSEQTYTTSIPCLRSIEASWSSCNALHWPEDWFDLISGALNVVPDRTTNEDLKKIQRCYHHKCKFTRTIFGFAKLDFPSSFSRCTYCTVVC